MICFPAPRATYEYKAMRHPWIVPSNDFMRWSRERNLYAEFDYTHHLDKFQVVMYVETDAEKLMVQLTYGNE